MQSVEIIREFRNGDLTPTSELEDLKYIGPYLHRGLRGEFRISGPVFTIRRFANSIRNLRLDALKERLGKAEILTSLRKSTKRDTRLYSP